MSNQRSFLKEAGFELGLGEKGRDILGKRIHFKRTQRYK